MATLNPITGQVEQEAGITSLPAANTTVANPIVSNEINQAYQNLFGRAADEAGAQYWASTGLTGDALTQAMVGGARGSDIGTYYKTGDLDISPDITTSDIRNYVTQNINDPFAIYSAAQKYNVDPNTIAAVTGMNAQDLTSKFNLAGQVAQEYQDIGRGLTGEQAADSTGFNYWYNQLQSGAIKPEDFEKTFLTSAIETVGKGGASEDVAAKTYIEALSKGYGGQDITGILNPLNVYEEFRSRGLTPEDIVAKNPQMTTQQITDYFANVGDLYTQNVDKTLEDIFGKDIVASEKFASVYTPEQKQNLVNNLLTGETTREEVAKSFQESGANKNQEASRIANIYAQAFGGDTEDAKALYNKLMGLPYSGTGKVDDEIYNRAKSVFDKSLTSEANAQAGITSLIKEAANKSGAENQKFFTDNPDLLTIYKDVGDTKSFNNAGTGGQYGYYQGIPIIKLSEADQVFNEMGTDYIQGNAPDRLDNDIGWDTGSLSAVEARGAAALGVRKTEGYTDENGQTYPATYSGDLTGLATKLGIDPTQFKDSYKTVTTTDPETGTETKTQVVDKSAQDKLYDAVNEAAKDFYFFAGKTGTGQTNSGGETSAFMRDDVSGNHAAVLYRKVGDKLIPIPETLKYYNGQMELSPGSWFSQTFGGLASLPFVAELALLSGQPWAYAAAKAAQTAALGGDIGDVAKSGALAYAGSKFLPQVSSGISEGLTNAGVTGVANTALTGATVGGGVAGLTGRDIGTGALMGGAGGALSYGANALVPSEGMAMANELGIDPKYQKLFANTLARLTPTILTGGKVDPTKVLMSYLMSKGKEKIKEGTT